MDERVPEVIRPLLEQLIALQQERLPGLLQAFYLEGSLALSGFNERLSDIDFIALLARRPLPEELAALREIHAGLATRYPRWQLEGRYLSVQLTGPFWIRHAGVLTEKQDFDFNSVEGWILKNRGLVLLGPPPAELPFSVDWDLLIREMRSNLNTYWAGWTWRPDALFVMLSDWGIQWTVLGVLRQFYSFRENSITTKPGAGEYALGCLPARWHRLITEALNIRAAKKGSLYKSNLLRMFEALSFLKFIIRLCNSQGLPQEQGRLT